MTVSELIIKLMTVQNPDLPVILRVESYDLENEGLFKEGDANDVYQARTIMGPCLVIQADQ